MLPALQHELGCCIEKHTFRRSGRRGVLLLAEIGSHCSNHRVRFMNGQILLVFLARWDFSSFLSEH